MWTLKERGATLLVIVVMIQGIDTQIKDHQTAHLECVIFNIPQLGLNSSVKQLMECGQKIFFKKEQGF
jgi:hypothetical protein